MAEEVSIEAQVQLLATDVRSLSDSMAAFVEGNAKEAGAEEASAPEEAAAVEETIDVQSLVTQQAATISILSENVNALQEQFRSIREQVIMTDLKNAELQMGLDVGLAASEDVTSRVSGLESVDDDQFEKYREDGEDAAAFSGNVYISGVKTTGLADTPALPYVKVDVAALTATEDAGPMPLTFPSNEEWYEKSKTFGDIHVTRF